MSAAKTPFIYPYFVGEGVHLDLFEREDDTESIGSVAFPIADLAAEYISVFAERGYITDSAAVEEAYALIDALREAANRLAEVLDNEEDGDAYA